MTSPTADFVGHDEVAQHSGLFAPKALDTVRPLARLEYAIAVPEMASKGWGNLNGALTEAVRDKDSRVGKLLAAATRKRMVEGDVVLGPGSLGLVPFTDIDVGSTVEQLATRCPDLIAGLAQHPGIGFVLVRSESLGGLVIGGGGIRYLLFPAGFELPDEPIVGAATVHHLFERWMASINVGTTPAPWTVPERSPALPMPVGVGDA